MPTDQMVYGDEQQVVRETFLDVEREDGWIVLFRGSDAILRVHEDRTWVLLSEAPDGGCGIGGLANSNAELVGAARAQMAQLTAQQSEQPSSGDHGRTTL